MLTTLLGSAYAPGSKGPRCSGSIHLDARPGAGTRVELRVPLDGGSGPSGIAKGALSRTWIRGRY
jgi:hypothetical protein